MKLTVAILLLPILAIAQVDKPISIYQDTERLLRAYLETEGNSILPSTVRVTNFIEKLSTHPDQYNKHQQRFLRQIFVKTHSRFLRTFKQPATFSQVFS